MILVVVIVYRLKKQRDTQANSAATDLALDVDMVLPNTDLTTYVW